MKRVGVILILVLSFFGLADSVYLSQHALNGIPLLCDIQNLSGCNIVAMSQYSHMFGIPLAEFGVLFYAIIFVLAALEIVIFDQLLRRVLQVVSFVGAIFSLYFMSVQLFVIQAFCVYCLVSALIAFLIFILASFIEPMRLTPPLASPPPKEGLSMPPAA